MRHQSSRNTLLSYILLTVDFYHIYKVTFRWIIYRREYYNSYNLHFTLIMFDTTWFTLQSSYHQYSKLHNYPHYDSLDSFQLFLRSSPLCKSRLLCKACHCTCRYIYDIAGMLTSGTCMLLVPEVPLVLGPLTQAMGGGHRQPFQLGSGRPCLASRNRF